MTCTERCRKAGPGQCCCSCSGEHHGEAAPIQQKRLALVSDALLEASRVDPVEMIRQATEVEIHPDDCDCVACVSWCPDLERAAAAGHAVVMLKAEDGIRHLEGCSCQSRSILGDVRREVWADVARREDAAIMGGGGPIPLLLAHDAKDTLDASIFATNRQPHDRTISGRTVHLSPAYRYTLDSDAGEPIWWAWYGDKHASAVDPDVAARKALGL